VKIFISLTNCFSVKIHKFQISSTSTTVSTKLTALVKKIILRNTDCGDCVVRLADTPNVEPEELPSAVYSTKKELEKNLRIGDPDSDKKSLECVCVIAVIQGGLE